MAITKRTILGETTINEETKSLGFLFLNVIEDDGDVISRVPYRRVIDPGSDVDAELATVETALASKDIKGGPLDPESIAKVREYVGREHTKAVIAAHQKRVAELLPTDPSKSGGGPKK